uniref:Uncharacterized protein n=1 Tax=Ciona intestinalis TaxID=7719 RepID=H2Y243_CIOIN
MLMPMARFRSHRYFSKPSARRVSCTRETWELSMACKLNPDDVQSHDASFTISFNASWTFFSRLPWTRRASNI